MARGEKETHIAAHPPSLAPWGQPWAPQAAHRHRSTPAAQRRAARRAQSCRQTRRTRRQSQGRPEQGWGGVGLIGWLLCAGASREPRGQFAAQAQQRAC